MLYKALHVRGLMECMPALSLNNIDARSQRLFSNDRNRHLSTLKAHSASPSGRQGIEFHAFWGPWSDVEGSTVVIIHRCMHV